MRARVPRRLLVEVALVAGLTAAARLLYVHMDAGYARLAADFAARDAACEARLAPGGQRAR